MYYDHLEIWCEVHISNLRIVLSSLDIIIDYFENPTFRVTFSHSFKFSQTLKFTYDLPNRLLDPKNLPTNYVNCVGYCVVMETQLD